MCSIYQVIHLAQDAHYFKTFIKFFYFLILQHTIWNVISNFLINHFSSFIKKQNSLLIFKCYGYSIFISVHF